MASPCLKCLCSAPPRPRLLARRCPAPTEVDALKREIYDPSWRFANVEMFRVIPSLLDCQPSQRTLNLTLVTRTCPGNSHATGLWVSTLGSSSSSVPRFPRLGSCALVSRFQRGHAKSLAVTYDGVEVV